MQNNSRITLTTVTLHQRYLSGKEYINSAISLLTLTNGKPATVTVDEVFDLAERMERWAWRDLLDKNGGTRAEETSAAPATPTPPAQAPPEPPRPTPAPPQREPRSNGDGQTAGEASAKQINAIFAIGQSKGYNSDALKALVKEKLGKSVPALTSREASILIDDLRAL